jgi:calcium-dependent protein kinase
VDELMRKVDTDGDGFINYTEFMTASMAEKRKLAKDELKKAFETFDKDGSGTISGEELRMALGIYQNGESWREILQMVDSNGDGEIDLKEFKRFLLSRD